MGWEIFLNGKPHAFTSEDLPALIHGADKSGASLFSLNLVKSLYRQGEPLLLITARPQAKDELLTEIKGTDFISLDSLTQLEVAPEKQVIHLLQEHIALLPKIVSVLDDFQSRIVLLKNTEALDKEALSLFYTHPLTIFSGDLNLCTEKEPLLQLKYHSKIFFSPLNNDFRLKLPENLEKYHGYYQGRIDQGTVYLQQSK